MSLFSFWNFNLEFKKIAKKAQIHSSKPTPQPPSDLFYKTLPRLLPFSKKLEFKKVKRYHLIKKLVHKVTLKQRSVHGKGSVSQNER
jgi:hypothetical protein